MEVGDISPSIVVVCFDDQRVLISSIHCLIPLSVILWLIGVQEASVPRVIDEEVSNDRRLGTHRHVGEMVVFEARCTAVDWVACQVIPFNPDGHLAHWVCADVGHVTEGTCVICKRCLTIVVHRDGDVLAGICNAVAVGIVVVFNPDFDVKTCRRVWQVIGIEADLLVCGWNHPCVVNHGSPVAFQRWIHLSIEDFHFKKTWIEGVNREIEWDCTLAVGPIDGSWAQCVAAFIAVDAESVCFLTGRKAKVDVEIEIATDHTRLVFDADPLNREILVRGVDRLLFQDHVVSAWVRGDVKILKTDAAGNVHDLIRFAIVQILRQPNVVTNLEGRDDCIVLNGVAANWCHQHCGWKAIHAVSSKQPSVDPYFVGVFPIGIDNEAPCDFLPVRDVGLRRGGFQCDQVAEIRSLSEAHCIGI